MADTRYQCSLQGAIIGSFYDKLLERLRGLCQPFETVYRIREVTLRTDASQGKPYHALGRHRLENRILMIFSSCNNRRHQRNICKLILNYTGAPSELRARSDLETPHGGW